MKKTKPKHARSVTDKKRIEEGRELAHVHARNVFAERRETGDMVLTLAHVSSPAYGLAVRQGAVKRDDGWAVTVGNRSTLPPKYAIAADHLPVMISAGQLNLLIGIDRDDVLVKEYLSSSGRSLFRLEGVGDDDPVSITPAGLLFLMLHMDPSEFFPAGGPLRDRLIQYQRLANAAIARDAAVRVTPRPVEEVLCERFGEAMRREFEAHGGDEGESAMEAFLDRLPAAD